MSIYIFQQLYHITHTQPYKLMRIVQYKPKYNSGWSSSRICCFPSSTTPVEIQIGVDVGIVEFNQIKASDTEQIE